MTKTWRIVRVRQGKRPLTVPSHVGTVDADTKANALAVFCGLNRYWKHEELDAVEAKRSGKNAA
jgi:hypothetical protein